MKELERVLGSIEKAKEEQTLAKQALDSAVDRYNAAWWKRHEAELELRHYFANKPMLDRMTGTE